MGSLKNEPMDLGGETIEETTSSESEGVKFVPNDAAFPVELFLSIVEDSSVHLTDGERISATLSQIDANLIEKDTLVELSMQVRVVGPKILPPFGNEAAKASEWRS